MTRNLDPWFVGMRSRVRIVVGNNAYVHTQWDDKTQLSPAMQALLEPGLLADHWRRQGNPAQ